MLVVVNTGIKERQNGANIGASKFRVVGGKLIDGVAGGMIGQGPLLIGDQTLTPCDKETDEPKEAIDYTTTYGLLNRT